MPHSSDTEAPYSEAAVITTPRLSLVPLRAALAQAALYDHAKLAGLLDARVPENWPNDDFRGALPLFLLLFSEKSERSHWSRLVIERQRRVLIGEVGFKDLPNGTGASEIGYGIAPDFQRQGYATEAARALIAWGFRQPGLTRVQAECHQDNLASIRVLEKLGMTRQRQNGEMLRWEQLKPPAAG